MVFTGLGFLLDYTSSLLQCRDGIVGELPGGIRRKIEQEIRMASATIGVVRRDFVCALNFKPATPEPAVRWRHRLFRWASRYARPQLHVTSFVFTLHLRFMPFRR